MKCPEGMTHEENERLLLMKTIYGLVQASRIYYKKYAGMMITKLERNDVESF